jgi:hypothetical protein
MIDRACSMEGISPYTLKSEIRKRSDHLGDMGVGVASSERPGIVAGLAGSECGPVAAFCEHGNESASFHNVKNLLIS